ncbi:MAG: LexA family transcriptional regulator [Candidatus Adiutrix sp.]|jgi:transcriptional regulator with XRE-family HTH domain|nr:LexA family transcriptional regulator [Candidatus Adiutrix sp.]
MPFPATHQEIAEAFRGWLKDYIRAHSLTQLQTALRLDVVPGTINHILNGRRRPTLELMEKMTARAGTGYREALTPYLSPSPGPEPRRLDDQGMIEQGFLKVPFSDDMRLAAGGGGAVPFTYEAAASPVVVHGPSLGRRSAHRLQAFRLGGDSMEPVLAGGGIVIADLTHNELDRLREGSIYVLCWDLYDGECAAKYLRWAEKGRWLSIESENKAYSPLVKPVDEVRLIGKIIWAWREFT